MGGYGSGQRAGCRARVATDQVRAIDVRRWQREKLLTHPCFVLNWTRLGQAAASLIVFPETDGVYLTYRYRASGDEWKVERRTVRLSWTRCHFGGRRAWFLCPHCERRVAVLHGSATIACRYCFRLAYSSTREGKDRRAGRRAEKIRARLKWRRGILWGVDRKPPYMHWDTFFRLAGQVAELTTVAMAPTLRRYAIRSDL